MNRNMNTTSHFSPQTISHLSQLDVLDHAYEAADIEPRSRVDAVSAVLASEPEPHEVAAKYAVLSIEGRVDAQELAEEALAAWQRAQTVESFRDTYARVVDGVTNERIGALRADTRKAVGKAFDSLIKRLAKASGKLDKAQPLNRELAFEQDTSAELKEAEAALATLSRYAITPSIQVRGNVGKILAIVSIPDVEPEKITRTWPDGVYTDPKDADPNRTAIRAMIHAADKNMDDTLIAIARGRWNNITFSIADDQEMQRREQAHHNAINRVADPNRNTENLVRVL